MRVLSRITIKDNIFLKNKLFKKIDLENNDQIAKIIVDLKNDYEDYWKNSNLINTSLKLPLTIKVSSRDKKEISNFENVLEEQDLVYDFFISKYDKDYIVYNIIFNGTPVIFLKYMQEKNFSFDTQNKVWILNE